VKGGNPIIGSMTGLDDMAVPTQGGGGFGKGPASLRLDRKGGQLPNATRGRPRSHAVAITNYRNFFGGQVIMSA